MLWQRIVVVERAVLLAVVLFCREELLLAEQRWLAGCSGAAAPISLGAMLRL